MRRMLVLVMLVGCGREHLSSVNSATSVLTQRVDFGSMVIGGTAHGVVTVENRSRLSETLTLDVAAPFAGPGTVELPGGVTLDVPLRFSPTAVGDVTATATFDGVSLTLTGTGLLAPPCVSGGCEVAAVDPVTGQCTHTPAAEGAACTSPDGCVIDGACHGGQCLGTLKDCDDHDACTTDACARGSGCVHVDTSASCPAVSDPCRAPSCDPVTGCGSAPVADGTPCGAVSCDLANVCLQGTCRQVVPPDGFTCSAASPCQAEGHCEARQCVVPAPTTLTPSWTRSPVGLDFQGVADEQGNLYWVECDSAKRVSCEAVSYTANGLERFRTALTSAQAATSTQLFDGGIFLIGNGEWLFAVDGLTGLVVWQQSMGGLVSELATTPGGGVIVAQVDAPAQPSFPITGLRQLDAATGALLVSSPAGSWDGLLVDTHGTAWVWLLQSGLNSIDASGVATLRLPMAGVPPYRAPRSVDAHGLVLLDDELFDPSTSTVTPSLFTGTAFTLGTSLQPPAGRVRVRTEADGSHSLLGAQATPWLARLNRNVAGPFASAHGTVFADGDWSGFAVTQVDHSGQVTFQCATTSQLALSGPAAFTGRTLAVMSDCATCLGEGPQLQVFELGPLGLPASGWVNPFGTPGRARHPR